MTRFIIASRKRPDMEVEVLLYSPLLVDLSNYIDNYEFSVVPKSMFTPAGKLFLGSDKSTILHKQWNPFRGLLEK